MKDGRTLKRTLGSLLTTPGAENPFVKQAEPNYGRGFVVRSHKERKCYVQGAVEAVVSANVSPHVAAVTLGLLGITQFEAEEAGLPRTEDEGSTSFGSKG
jgi:hypothetical protein